MAKCIVCKKEEEQEEMNNIRINEWNGYCHSSSSADICDDCFKKNSKMTEHGIFLNLEEGKLFYDEHGLGVYGRVHNKQQIDRIFNREYYAVLKMLGS